MKYKLLSKAFYQSRGLYEQLYTSRIQGESTYLFDFEIKGYKGFVVINHEILDKIEMIYKLNKELYLLTNTLPKVAVDQYTRTCLIDEIRMTNDIEGVYSTRKEIKDIILDKGAKKKYKRLYALVKKYQTLLSGTEVALATCEDIRRLYDDFVLEDVVKEEPGNAPDGQLFRADCVYVAGRNGEIVHSGLKPEAAITQCLSQGLEMLKSKDYSFLIRMAVFHYMFGYIHPFYDGNGRMSRFISSYLLTKELHFLVSCRLSCAIKNQLSAYYKSFTIINDEKNRGDLTPFVITFLDILVAAEQELCDTLYDKKVKLDFYKDKMSVYAQEHKMASIAFVLIQNTLFGDAGLSIKQLAEASGVGMSNTRNTVKSLEEIGIIKKEREGKAVLYDIDLECLGKL